MEEAKAASEEKERYEDEQKETDELVEQANELSRQVAADNPEVPGIAAGVTGGSRERIAALERQVAQLGASGGGSGRNRSAAY